MLSSSARHSWRSFSLDGILSALHDEAVAPPSMDDLVCILLRCRRERNRACAVRLHAYLRTFGLEGHETLGNYLIPMLAEVGNLQDAQRVFDMLVHPNEFSQEALLTGYIKCGSPLKALSLFQKLEKHASFRLSDHVLVPLLKACSGARDLKIGIELHSEISRFSLLENDVHVGSMLVDMYVKCGSLAKAQQVFSRLPVQDVVSWTTIMAGYVEHGYAEHAILFYDLMQSKGVRPTSVTFVCILKACGIVGGITKARELHLQIEDEGLLQEELVGNTLIDTYATCGCLLLARQVFDKLPKRNVVSWNALIKGYVEGLHFEEAIKCFDQMQADGLSPSAVTYVSSLKACGALGLADKGEEICNKVEREGLLCENLFVGGALIAMYVKFGSLQKARQVFDKMPDRDLVVWTALISGYVEKGDDEEALALFEQMQMNGIFGNAITLISLVKSCANLQDLDRGCEIHAEIERQGLVQKDCMVGNSLVDMYSKCGDLVKAKELFDRLSDQDIVSWNALIGGYTEHGFAAKALLLFEQMQVEGVSPDGFTYIYCLKSCGSMQDSEKGAEIHFEIKRQGLLESDIIGNALVDMYAKCGMLSKAQEVFDRLLVRDVISWTALITGYTEIGDGEKALSCFERMQNHGVPPNAVTLLCSLKACGSIGAIDKGVDIHSEIERQGLLHMDLAIGNALIDMYAKCGLLHAAQQVFDKIRHCDVVSWNTLIAGYIEQGNVEDALSCFKQMQFRAVHPNFVTFLWILKACGSIGATETGVTVHGEIERLGLSGNGLVGNTVVHMYAKCGALNTAIQVFDKLSVRDVVSWTSLMAGYAEIEERKNVFNIFGRMLEEGVKPNPVTFVVVLTACTRKGLYSECQTFFEAMSVSYGVIPNLEHHSCVVNLLGRRGELDMAMAMIEKMPFNPSPILWNSIMGACNSWGSVRYAKQAFGNAMGFKKTDSVVYCHPSNLYKDA